MKYDMLTIEELKKQERLRGVSPTHELLTKWGHQNHTVSELFVFLSRMQHYQAMLVLKQFGKSFMFGFNLPFINHISMKSSEILSSSSASDVPDIARRN